MVNTRAVSIVLLLFSIAAVAAVIVLAVLYSNEKKDKVCTTAACISAANMILKNMDPKADPCEDFNLFACGKFLEEGRIADDQTTLDSFGDLRNTLANRVSDQLEKPISTTEPESTKNSKRYYLSCMNEVKIESDGERQFLDVLNTEYGGWPLLSSAAYNPTETPTEKLISYFKRNTRPIVSVSVTSNPKVPSEYVVGVSQAGWYFSKQYYDNANFVKAYKDYIYKVAEYMGAATGNVNYRTEIDSMYELEVKFGKIILTAEEQRNLTYTEYTVPELQTVVPELSWREIINGVFSDLGITVSDTEKLYVYDISYLQKAAQFFDTEARTNRKNLDNMLAWSTIRDRSTYLPKKYKDARLDFDKVYSGSTTLAPRTRTCANTILNIMPYAVGRLYVEKYFDESSKDQAVEMIENIRYEFREMLKSEVAWMDRESKVKADEKAAAIDVKIGYPDYTYNNTYLDQVLYPKYQFVVDNFIQNNMVVAKSDAATIYGRLREKRNLKDWISGPAVVNAFYASTLNQICFPAGILQPPFYDVGVPKYLNYGGIGLVIGHEITHGFDDQGRRYDKDGVFYPDGTIGLWTNATIESYKSRAACIVNQYSSYLAKQVNMTLNGAQTQGENIADNGGIRESFKAYQRWVKKNGKEPKLPGLDYTPEQLFFINHGQVWCSKFRDETLRQRILTGVHSPGEFRIRGPTSNYDEFAKAFKCKANTGNNPEKKCIVW